MLVPLGALALCGLPVLVQSGGIDRSPERIAVLEKRVADYPADVDSRAQLLSLHMRKPAYANRELHAWWIVENRPDHSSMRVALSVLTANREDGTVPSTERLERTLKGHLERRGDDPQVLVNVAGFYTRLSYEKAEELLLKARKLPVERYTPSHAATAELAGLYASAILKHHFPQPSQEVRPDAARVAERVKTQLLSTEDPMLSGFAGYHLAAGGRDLQDLRPYAERLLKIGLEAAPDLHYFKLGMEQLHGKATEQ